MTQSFVERDFKKLAKSIQKLRFELDELENDVKEILVRYGKEKDNE